MTTASGLTVTHTSSVTTDQIDHLGHMNVRYYGVNACAATRSLVGTDPIVDMYTRHHREQLVGADLEVRSGLLDENDSENDSDGTTTLYHELANTETGDIAASFVHQIRSGDSRETSIDGVARIELPAHGQPRSIDLTSIMSTPSLAEVRRLDLALRAPRTIDEGDMADGGTGGGTTVAPDMAAMLFWAGDAADGSEEDLLHVGPEGQNIGWATMETRVVVHRLPSIGTRIQSFCATTSIADKTTQQAMWVYDLDAAGGNGELLATFDVVSVVFDIDARRAMSIPAEMRTHHESKLHPELAARPLR